MKKSTVIFALLMLSLTSFTQNSGLWLLTAKITVSYSMQRDTLISFMAGNKKWDKEKHTTVKTVSSSVISAVIENQAENMARDFVFDSDAGEPVNITVAGQGSHSESSNYLETIDGTMVDADIRDINVSGSAGPNTTVQFYYSDDSKSVSISTGINAKGSDKGRMFDDEWKDFGGDIDHYYISCAGGCDVSSDNKCKITKTTSGYQATWKSSENKQRHSVDGTAFITSETTLDFTISPYKEPDKPEVNLYGCSELSTEEQSNVMASGKPEGGKFRFWVEPDNLFNVQSDGESSAILTGATPGKGMLYVEYTSPEGKTNTASQPASLVKLENYNGGQDIPHIALYDIDGKRLSGKITVPYSSAPDEANALVDFVSGNPSVFTVVASADNLDIQGIKTGKTTLKAKDNCGNTIGPTVEVEVVNCDKETVEALKRMKQAAIENLQDAAENLKKISGSKEFEKARDDLVSSTASLLAKAGLTIITSGESPSAAVNTVTDIAEAGAAISDMIASGSKEEFYGNALKTAYDELGGKVIGAIFGVAEVQQAAQRFGENIGQILYHEDVLKSAMENWEKADKDLKRIEQLQQICKDDKTEPQKKEEPKADQTPKPADPAPKPAEPTPKPTEPSPAPTEEPPAVEPAEGETPGEGGEISPPPPTSEPRQVGLPYSPEECGCDKTKEISVSSADFSTLQAGIKNIGDCVEKFNSTAVPDYANTLKELSALTDTLKVAADGDPEIFRVRSTEAKPQLDSLIERTKSYEEAGKTFLKEFEKCPESVTTGMDVLKSAVTVTVDSVTTKY